MVDATSTGFAGDRDERGWIPWSPTERESFFDAIERHRRASWRVAAVCAVAIAVLTLVLAVLLAPLIICALGLAIDVANLIVPMPDVLGAVGRAIDPLFEEETFDLVRLLHATALAAIPGLAVIGLAVFALQRALRQSPLFDAGELRGRAPDRSVVAEQRLANVVEEMAIAAAIAPPHVLIVPGGVNAAVFGRDDGHTTILVGEELLSTLNRAQMQGAIAHLIGSIAGGDMPIGMRAALTFSLFGLMARVTSCFGDREEVHHLLRLLRTLVWPTRAGTARLIRELADPFGTSEHQQARARKQKSDDKLTWREWALMPLVGPIVMSGFVAGLVSSFLLSPLVSLAWRRRKYMADAAAVRLTRDPDTLAAALRAMVGQGTGLQSWAMHMAVTPGSAVDGGLLGGQVVSIFPSIERRYKALGRMGAEMRPLHAAGALPLPLVLLFGFLGALCGWLGMVAVVLLIWLSIALSGLFTIFPAALLHALLRAIGR
ncbi:MAG TPA: M48 family metalloprotease [Burkholderiaceae bacterium]|nr:M48 family metalloprotease [Burkholderiaceae bacterium]